MEHHKELCDTKQDGESEQKYMRASRGQLSMQVRHQTGWVIAEKEGRSGCQRNRKESPRYPC